jgi:hypothetical protein
MIEVIKIKFNINKYSYIFNSVLPGYRVLTYFIIMNQYLNFPGERYNYSFTDIEFYIINSSPNVYRITARL